jgi:hypothetical protein
LENPGRTWVAQQCDQIHNLNCTYLIQVCCPAYYLLYGEPLKVAAPSTRELLNFSMGPQKLTRAADSSLRDGNRSTDLRKHLRWSIPARRRRRRRTFDRAGPSYSSRAAPASGHGRRTRRNPPWGRRPASARRQPR